MLINMTTPSSSRAPALLRTAAVTFGAVGGALGLMMGGVRVLGMGWFSGAPSWWGYVIVLGVPAALTSLITISAGAGSLLSAIWMYIAGACLSISMINPFQTHTPLANTVFVVAFTGHLVLLSSLLFTIEYVLESRTHRPIATTVAAVGFTALVLLSALVYILEYLLEYHP